MENEKEPIQYVCKKFPKFSFRISNTRYKFNDGLLFLEDETHVKALDALILKNSTFTQNVVKIDKEAAEVFVRERIKNLGANRLLSGAKKGGVDSQDILNSQDFRSLQERDIEMSNLSKEAADELVETLAKDSSLILTEKEKNPIKSSVDKASEIAQNSSLKMFKQK